MPPENTSLDGCKYDLEDVSGTLRRYYKLLANSDSCPHIRKIKCQRSSVEFYAIMDSNCHIFQPHLGSKCQKGESSVLRLVAGKMVENRSTKPQAVTCTLRSRRSDLLEFKDGHIEATFSILDLRGKPIWVGPIFRKAWGGLNWGVANVQVKKVSEAVLNHVVVDVEVYVWKEYPHTAYNVWPLFLSVAIPPVTVSEGGNDMEIIITPIVEVLKMFVLDIYKYLKDRLPSSGQGEKSSPAISLQGKTLQSDDITHELVSSHLADVSEMKLKTLSGELEAQRKRYMGLCDQRDAFVETEHTGVNASDRASVKAQIKSVEREITDVAERIYDIMRDLFGPEFKLIL